MIESTLGSLMALMGFCWVATQFLKGFMVFVPQKLLALIVGEAVTLLFWHAGLVTLDGAEVGTWVGAAVAAVYALFAVATSMQAHDAGSNPETLIKRIKKGKPV